MTTRDIITAYDKAEDALVAAFPDCTIYGYIYTCLGQPWANYNGTVNVWPKDYEPVEPLSEPKDDEGMEKSGDVYGTCEWVSACGQFTMFVVCDNGYKDNVIVENACRVTNKWQVTP